MDSGWSCKIKADCHVHISFSVAVLILSFKVEKPGCYTLRTPKIKELGCHASNSHEVAALTKEC